MEKSMEAPQKPYDPAIPFLGLYPKECKSDYNKGTCIPMFIAALFTVAKLWLSQDAPLLTKGLRKMCYLCTMKFYSTIKKNEILSSAGKLMELENIILNERKPNAAVFSHMWNIDLIQIQAML
jgi:hypothetical protein